MAKAGYTQRKILLLLLGGVALGLSGNPKKYFKTLDKISKEWKNIEKQKLKRSIRALYESKLVKTEENEDGTVTLVLTEKGKKKALTFNIDEMQIKIPEHWDGKWRIVLFDIPEKQKQKREILRFHLKRLGFFEFQESVFILPYNCLDEMEYIIEFYELRRFVRFIMANFIDNEIDLKNHFQLN